MRKLLVIVRVIALAVPMLAQATPMASASPSSTQVAAGPEAQAPGARNPVGVLGPVDALGQEVKRPPAPTDPPPRLPDGTIDLTDGIWVSVPSFGPNIAQGLKSGEALPLLPSAAALMSSRTGPDDPVNWCLPLGVLRYSPYPFRFIQNSTHKKPTHMYILSEWMGSFRQIFMDGRQHPPEPDPTWFGHSIGSYENDTLVIDTVGFNDKFWFDRRGTPHTAQLHTIERWTRLDRGHLMQEVTIDDPGAYSRPFTVRFPAMLSAPGDDLIEYVCQENNQYGIASGSSKPSAGP
jgi:hypothetical protein